jgi:hypothetical protein
MSRIAGLLAGLAAIAAIVAPANAMTLDEFDALTPVEKGKVIEDTIRRIHSHVTARRPDLAKAACIQKLFVPTSRDTMPRGITLLIDDLEEVADGERADVGVETVVLDFINRECPSAGAAQQR